MRMQRYNFFLRKKRKIKKKFEILQFFFVSLQTKQNIHKKSVYIKMKKKSLFFLLLALFICISACKTKSHLPEPNRKKKCDCPRFSQHTAPYQSVYFVSSCHLQSNF